jgi:hypothetical protein
MTFGGFVWRFVAAFFVTAALLVGLVWFAAWKLGIPVGPHEAPQGRPYTAEAWRAQEAPAPVRKAPGARKAPPGARKAPPEPATVTEARRWSACGGPACYHDVRAEAAPWLNRGL